jgi:hypothetical protein
MLCLAICAAGLMAGAPTFSSPKALERLLGQPYALMLAKFPTAHDEFGNIQIHHAVLFNRDVDILMNINDGRVSAVNVSFLQDARGPDFPATNARLARIYGADFKCDVVQRIATCRWPLRRKLTVTSETSSSRAPVLRFRIATAAATRKRSR